MKIPYFDAHCDTITAVLERGGSLAENDYMLDLGRLAACEPAAQFFAVWGGRYEEKVALLRTELKKSGLGELCRSIPEARTAAKAGKIAALTVERGLRKGLFAIRKEARCPRDATLHGGTAKFFHPAHQKAFILVLRRHKAAGPCIRRRRHCSPARPAGRP